MWYDAVVLAISRTKYGLSVLDWNIGKTTVISGLYVYLLLTCSFKKFEREVLWIETCDNEILKYVKYAPLAPIKTVVELYGYAERNFAKL